MGSRQNLKTGYHGASLTSKGHTLFDWHDRWSGIAPHAQMLRPPGSALDKRYAPKR